MRLTDRQKFALAVRRLQRSVAVAIYPPFGLRTYDELDIEFQHGLEIAYETIEMRIKRAHENGIAVGIAAAKEEHDE